MIVTSEDFKKEVEEVMGEDSSKYFDCLNDSPTKGLCVNNKKLARDVFKSVAKLPIEQLPFNEDCFKYLGAEKLGLSVFHKAGAFYMQEPSAMVPGLVLPLKPNDKVLDVCASPGGKTFQIARRLNGVLLSNEIDFLRAKVLQENVERLGLDNVIVSSFSPEQLGDLYEGMFDAMLVDAPCSGEGMFRREAKAVENWSLKHVEECAKMQRDILSHVIKCLKKGGYLVYSTCTFSKKENEENVKFLVENGFEILKIDAIFGGVDGIKIEGHETQLSKRFYPQNGIGEGQFVCLLRKLIDGNESFIKPKKTSLGKREEKIITDFFKQNFEGELWKKIKDDLVLKNDSVFYSPCKNLILDEKRVLSFGVKLGVFIKNRFEPSFNLFTAFGKFSKLKVNLTISQAEEYFKGNTLMIDEKFKGWCCVMYEGMSLGGGKLVDGVLKNHYPKGLRKN